MSVILTSWTEEEYGRVARALRYPLTPDIALNYGNDIYMVTVRLRSQLPELNPHTKAVALELANDVIAAEEELLSTSSKHSGVKQVGEIHFDKATGVSIQTDMLSRRRQRLADAIGIPVNPAATGTRMGGLNGTWSC